MNVLMECIELQERKGRDYQNPRSTVKQAHHYPHGIDTILDMVHQKMIRAKSLTEAVKFGDGKPNYESLEDTLKDAINYLSFGVSWLRNKMDGQLPDRDMFNMPVDHNTEWAPWPSTSDKKESDK